jgi:hypothetical protein
MIGLIEAARRLSVLSPDDVFIFVFSRNEVLEFIERLNREQLRTGIRADGETLRIEGDPKRDYSPSYRAFKTRRGVPKDIVDLNLTGKFYDSIQAKYESGNVILQGDPIKDGQDLRKRWGNQIIGLTDENIELVREFIIGFVIPDFFRTYLK